MTAPLGRPIGRPQKWLARASLEEEQRSRARALAERIALSCGWRSLSDMRLTTIYILDHAKPWPPQPR